MNINFKGLKNPKITSDTMQSPNGVIKINAYRLAAQLTNDSKGMHFDNFYESLDKIGVTSAWKYVPNTFRNDKFIFDVSKIKIENIDIPPKIDFMLNCQTLPLDNDKILPIFSFLAKAISFVKNNSHNKEQIKYAQEMNDIVQKAVVDYIG